MQKYFFTLISLFLMLLCGHVLPLHAESVVLLSHNTKYDLGASAKVFKNTGDTRYSVETLHEAPEWFVPNSSKSIGMVFDPHSHWVRLDVLNQTSNPQWLLEVAYALVDEVTVFQQVEGRWHEQTSGVAIPVQQRIISHPHHVFELNLPSQTQSTFYLRLQTNGVAQVPITLWNPAHFEQQQVFVHYQHGLYYGIMLAMFLYNLLLFLSIRDRCSLYYCLHILSYIFLQLSIDGLGFQYLWHESVSFNIWAYPLFLNSTVFLGVLFSFSFLNVSAANSYWKAFFKSGLLLSGVSVISSYFLPHQLAWPLGLGCVVILASGVLAFSAIRWKQGDSSAHWFLIAGAIFLSGSVLNVLMNLDILPYHLWIKYSIQFGSVAVVILFSLAIAGRINQMKQKILEAQQQLLKQERRATNILKSLHIFSQKISTFENPNQLIEEALTEIIQHVPVSGVYLMVYDHPQALPDHIPTISIQSEQQESLQQIFADVESILTTSLPWAEGSHWIFCKSITGIQFCLYRDKSQPKFNELEVKTVQRFLHAVQSMEQHLRSIISDLPLLNELHAHHKSMEDVLYITMEAPYCSVVFDDPAQPNLSVRVSLQKLDMHFGDDVLLRVHRSYLVNPTKVKHIRRVGSHEYQVSLESVSDEVLPVSRSHVAKLRKYFPQFFNRVGERPYSQKESSTL